MAILDGLIRHVFGAGMEYAETQPTDMDAAHFVALCMLHGYTVRDADKALKLAELAIKWAKKHGTPTPEKVAGWLKARGK